jgi:hypothetical protein
VKDKEERHPEGAYYLDWRRNGVRVRLSVGKNAQDALTQRDRKTFELNAANHGVVVQNEVQNGDGTNGDGRKPLSVSEGMREDPGGTAYARLHPRLVFFLRPRRPQPLYPAHPPKTSWAGQTGLRSTRAKSAVFARQQRDEKPLYHFHDCFQCVA